MIGLIFVLIPMLTVLILYFVLIMSAAGFSWGLYLMYLDWLTKRQVNSYYTSRRRLNAFRQAARGAVDTPYVER